MRQRLNSISGLTPRTTLAGDEKIVDTHVDGRPIIERTYTKEVREPVLDAKGEQVWKMNQLGVKTVPVFQLRSEPVTETYVYDELKTGHNRKNHHFREDPVTAAKAAKRDRVSKLRDEFFEAAEDRGLNADQIADFISDGRGQYTKVKPKKKTTSKARATV